MWHIVLFSNLKGLLGPATVSVKSLYPYQCTCGCLIALVLVICTLIVETVVVGEEWGFAASVLRRGEGLVVKPDPPGGCLVYSRSDGVLLGCLIRIVCEITARMGGVAKDALLEGIAGVALDFAWAGIVEYTSLVAQIDGSESEPGLLVLGAVATEWAIVRKQDSPGIR